MMQTHRQVPFTSLRMAFAGLFGVVALVLLFAAQTALAQFITGSLSGTVRDTTGAVVPGAQVTLINESTNESRVTSTNSAGYFTFAAVPAGTYTVAVSATGFQLWKVIDVLMNSGDIRTVPDIPLKVGAASETVSVTATPAQIVPIDSGERSDVISSKDLERLSLEGRDVSEVLKLLPGSSVSAVVSGSGGGTSLDFSTVASVGSAVGNGISTSGAPYRGGSGYLFDGVNIIDVGCNCYSIAVPNPDMVSEVKVDQSFGADEPNGPVVVSVTSKSGGDTFHGEAYFYGRNQVLNSNTWLNDYQNSKTPAGKPLPDPKQSGAWYYPGGNIGGPIPIPGYKHKLFFWAGYEYYHQLLPSSTPFESYVPSAGMMAGNFTSSGSGNSALCPGGFVKGGTNWCGDPTGSLDANGNVVNPAALPVDPGAKALMKMFPAANANPATTPGGYNYVFAYSNPQNGYVWRGRVDYDINANNKAFVGYQQGHTVFQTLGHLYWNPSYDIPYPGGGLNEPNTSRTMTVNFVSVIRPTLTNEFIFGWGWANGPTTPSDLSAIYKSTLGYPYQTIWNSASLVAPSVDANYAAMTFPDISQPALFDSAGVFPLLKASPSFADNVTEVWKTHTIKVGAFTELIGNDGGVWQYPNGQFSFGSAPETNKVVGSAVSPTTLIGATNPTANLVMGIANYFSQNSYENVQDQASRTVSAYVMDNWKFNRRLTVNVGVRWDHVGRWYDRQGVGSAVWYPQLFTQDVATNQAAKSMVIEYPGVRWLGIDSGIPNGGSPTRLAWATPRVGFAYDLQGSGQTVIRGGWGEYVWNDMAPGGALSTAQNVLTYNSPGSQDITLAQVPLQTPSGNNMPAGSITAMAYNDYQDPLTYSWNLTVDRQLPWQSMLEVAYVGNSTHHMLMDEQTDAVGIGGGEFVNQNKIPLGGLFKPDPVTGAAAPADPENNSTFNVEDYYPYSGCISGGGCYGYGTNSISVGTHIGVSNYNGLQVAWLKQRGHASWDFNYTWSKTLGVISSTFDAFNMRGNYGILNIDRPQVFNASYAYSFGAVYHGGEKLVGGVANGWNISGTTTVQEGGNLQGGNLGLSIQQPIPGNTSQYESLTSRTYFGTDADSILPITTCSPKSQLQAHQLMNLSCFSAPTVGTQGDRQIHPYLTGPVYDDSDLTVYKTFNITERQNVQIRAAAFDFMNHSLWGSTGGNLLSLYYSTSDGGHTFTPNANVYSGDGVSLTGTCGAGTSVWGCENQKAPFSGAGYARIIELSVKYNF
jgi:hypothetical protein